MDRFTQRVLPTFGLSKAMSLGVIDRIDRCITLARDRSANYPMPKGIPPVADGGATFDEIASLQSRLGISIPSELRMFWSRCRYLCLDDGMNIGGFDHAGIQVAEHVWLSENHMPGRRLLVIGAYWRYADGDQLLVDLDDATFPVAVYLHEDGPLFERYAPSFTLALWRLVHETED
jgi:hypothetical protein